MSKVKPQAPLMFYDITIDNTRPLTQKDLDQLLLIQNAYVVQRNFLTGKRIFNDDAPLPPKLTKVVKNFLDELHNALLAKIKEINSNG